jgi:hypothetical protein
MEVDGGGGLYFKAELDNEQMNGAIEETVRRIQGLSDGTVAGGKAMDNSILEMTESIKMQERTVADLQAKYRALRTEQSNFSLSIEEHAALQTQAAAVRDELAGESAALNSLQKELKGLQQESALAAGALQDMGTSGASLEQVKRSVAGAITQVARFKDETVKGSGEIDSGFSRVAANIDNAYRIIDEVFMMNSTAVKKLENDYRNLISVSDKALTAGDDNKYRSSKSQAAAIAGEITVRKKLLNEIAKEADALEKSSGKFDIMKEKAGKAANAQVKLRTELMNVKNAMAALEGAGKRDSDEFANLEKRAVELSKSMYAVNHEIKTLSSAKGSFLEGIGSGVVGLTGAVTALSGAMSVFAGENDDLQKIMVRVQSLMSVSIGMQQVAQTLNKDSAFQQVTLNGLKEWWAKAVEKAAAAETAGNAATEAATIAEKVNTVAEEAATLAEEANSIAEKVNTAATMANTAAERANTAATGGQTVAANAGTAANLTLAGAFRAVGFAIKSIPVFGWVIAGISALIGLVTLFTSKSRQAEKAAREFNAAVAEGSYQAVGSVKNLSSQWSALGDNLDAKKRFIEDNKKAFDELGVSIRDIADAENLLVKNKEAFIAAQIAKAKAAVMLATSGDVVKESIQADRELEEAEKTPTVTRRRTLYGGTAGTYAAGWETVVNPAIAKAKDKKAEAEAKLKGIYEDVEKYTQESVAKMEESEVSAVDKYEKGTIGAIEKVISRKQELLKGLLPDSEQFKETAKEIADLQKQLEAITGKSKTEGKAVKDPFLEKLEKQKAEYQRFMKWINSGDEALAKAAYTEFEGLLRQGTTYIDYLKKQRETIEKVGVAERTSEQTAQLKKLNDQIAKETRKTVLEAFNTELSDQLGNAKSAIEMLKIIEEKRKALEGDSTELGVQKRERLDNAETDAVRKQKEETKALMKEWASWIDKKAELDAEYYRDAALLDAAYLKSTTDGERAAIDRARANRERQWKEDTKNGGDADYSALLDAYGTFEEKKQAIIDRYEKERATAREHNDQRLITKLNEAQRKAISKLSTETLADSDTWKKMFEGADDMTLREIDSLIGQINQESVDLGVEFTGEDVRKLNKELKELRNDVASKNPFTALYAALQKFNGEASSANLKNVLDAGSVLADGFNSIAGSMREIAEQTGNEKLAVAAEIMADVSSNWDAAQKGAEMFGGWWGAVIGGLMDGIPKIIKWMNDDKDKEKAVQRHAAAVAELEKAYRQLSWEIDRALGDAYYEKQQEAIANLEQQRHELEMMASAERSKKKNKGDAEAKAAEYEEQAAEIMRNIQDIINGMAEDIVGGTAKSIAEDLGNAFIDAFSRGEDAAAAWGKTVDDIVGRIIRNMIMQSLIEPIIGDIIDEYTARWFSQYKEASGPQTLQEMLEQGNNKNKYKDAVLGGYAEELLAQWQAEIDKNKGDPGGRFLGWDKVVDTLPAFSADMMDAVSGVSTFFDNLPEDLKKYFFTEADKAATSLTGAVKGVTEETAGLVAGQMNAMRVNQMEATEILRGVLLALNTIAQNTAYNRFLQSIDAKLDRIITGSGDPLRSQGLILK